MNYQVEILESKTINGKPWILCKGKLSDYLNSLKINFYDFAIQRRIVKNQYLDTLFNTIKKGEPIPIITLTYKENEVKIEENRTASFDMDKIEILDGLQRTFRLWSYQNVAEKYRPEYADKLLEYVKDLKIEPSYELMFESGVISTAIIRELIKTEDINEIKNIFSDFDIYFIVWAGLDDHDTVRKMLVLNAGQKQVSKVHQFELLFLHIWDEIKDNSKVQIKREKDPISSSIKKGEKEIGVFMFSSVIVSLMSLVEKKPMRVSTEKLIADENEEESDSDLYQKVFNQPFINIFLTNLYELDSQISNVEKEYGKSWFVKDTTLSGVFAALGKSIEVNHNWTVEELEQNAINGFKKLNGLINDQKLSLGDFQKEYDTFSSRSVNIGNHIRNVIAYHVGQLLQGEKPTWKNSFIKIKEGK